MDLGYLDDTNHSVNNSDENDENGDDDKNDLKRGCQLNLPLWLVRALDERNYILIEKPLYFTQRFCDSLLVEPKVVNLKCKCYYWYIIGLKICQMYFNNNNNNNNMECQLILTWMQKSLESRNEEIIDQSHHYRSKNFETFKSYLTFCEEILFNEKHDTQKFIYNWKNGNKYNQINQNNNNNHNNNHHNSNNQNTNANKSILGKRKFSQM